MAKQQKVEASVQTLERFDDGTGEYVFVIYEQESNKTLYTSKTYTRRSNAKRGATRYAKRQNMKIVLWVK